jgi:hypothetical protein
MTKVVSDLLAGGAANLVAIAESLSVALALRSRPDIRGTLRVEAECSADRSLVLKLPTGPAGLEIGPAGQLRPLRQHELIGGRSLHELLQNSPALDEKMKSVRSKTLEDAQALLLPFVLPGNLPSRDEFEAVFEWAPLFEVPAYAFAAKASSTLDEWRPAARSEAAKRSRSKNSILARYYSLNHTLAHFVLISSQPMASPWLSDIARSFAAMRWTPTFGLTRERTIWLAAAAAKSVAAFGLDVVESYFKILGDAYHAFDVYDALFGLTSIAIAHESARELITRSLISKAQASAVPSIVGAEYAAVAFRSAIDVLEKRSSDRSADRLAHDRLGWSSESADGLATHQAFRSDPCQIGPDGLMVVFGALPRIINTMPAKHYPRPKVRRSLLLPRPSEFSELFMRAWSAAESPQTRTLH